MMIIENTSRLSRDYTTSEDDIQLDLRIENNTNTTNIEQIIKMEDYIEDEYEPYGTVSSDDLISSDSEGLSYSTGYTYLNDPDSYYSTVLPDELSAYTTSLRNFEFSDLMNTLEVYTIDKDISLSLDFSYTDSVDDTSLSLYSDDKLKETALIQTVKSVGIDKIIESLQPEDRNVLLASLLSLYPPYRQHQKKLEKSNTDEDFHWTMRYIEALTGGDTIDTSSAQVIINDFNSTALTYGKIIISERYIPLERKSIKPATKGGKAGGDKYVISGILFKFAKDVLLGNGQWIYGVNEESDEMAIKGLGHELKALSAIVTHLPTKQYNVFVPLMCIIDYLGFRLCAISLLPISGDDSLVYGTSDGGKTLQNDLESEIPELKMCINAICDVLKLEEHGVMESSTGNIKNMMLAADVEIHKSTYNGKTLYFVLDLARFLPSSDPFHAYTKMFRPEFLRYELDFKISADSFSGFGRPNSKELNSRTHDAILLLEQKVIDFASDLNILDIEEINELSSSVHQRGINLRYLGLLRFHITNQHNREMIKMEMIARCLKHIINRKLRKTMKRACVAIDEPYRNCVVNFYRKLDTPNFEFWKENHKNSIKAEILHRFGAKALTDEELSPNYSLVTRPKFEELMDVLSLYTNIFISDGAVISHNIEIVPKVKIIKLFTACSQIEISKKTLEAARFSPYDQTKYMLWEKALERLLKTQMAYPDVSLDAVAEYWNFDIPENKKTRYLRILKDLLSEKKITSCSSKKFFETHDLVNEIPEKLKKIETVDENTMSFMIDLYYYGDLKDKLEILDGKIQGRDDLSGGMNNFIQHSNVQLLLPLLAWDDNTMDFSQHPQIDHLEWCAPLSDCITRVNFSSCETIFQMKELSKIESMTKVTELILGDLPPITQSFLESFPNIQSIKLKGGCLTKQATDYVSAQNIIITV